MRTTSVRVAMMLGAAVICTGIMTSCSREPEIAPPTVHFDQTECAICRMIVSDDRFAAALLEVDERGRREHRVFDDIGCLFEYEEQQPEREIMGCWVVEYDTGEWIDMREVVFVHSSQIHSPMAFGLAAVRTRERADELAAQMSGAALSVDDARLRYASGALTLSALPGQEDGLPKLTDTRRIGLADGGALTVELRTAQRIVRGKHAFELQISADRAGTECKNLTIQIRPDMPSMGHGSPDNVDPVHVGGGVYRGSVNFTMPGAWVVHVRLARGDQALGETSFEFEVQR